MKKKEKVDITSKKVLDNYLVHSPSKLPIENVNYFREHLAKRELLFRDRLKLPRQVFDGAELLDLGSGTGEQDLLYAMWGSHCTLVDMNPVSVEQSISYFEEFGLQKQLRETHTGSLFDFRSEKEYDIVISEGVLHHTDDPEYGFQKLVSNLKVNGFVILQLAFDSSHFQRSSHRFILDYLCGEDTDCIVDTAKLLFHETIDRAHRYGGRSTEQIIFDFYTNPKHKGIAYHDIFDWFQKNDINYYSSSPSLEPTGLLDGLHMPPPNQFFYENRFIGAFNDLLFMLASEGDGSFYERYKAEGEEVIAAKNKLMEAGNLADYEYGDGIEFDGLKLRMKEYVKAACHYGDLTSTALSRKAVIFAEEFCTLVDIMQTKNIGQIAAFLNNTKVFNRGYIGVPSNYIVGYRRPYHKS